MLMVYISRNCAMDTWGAIEIINYLRRISNVIPLVPDYRYIIMEQTR